MLCQIHMYHNLSMNMWLKYNHLMNHHNYNKYYYNNMYLMNMHFLNSLLNHNMIQLHNHQNLNILMKLRHHLNPLMIDNNNLFDSPITKSAGGGVAVTLGPSWIGLKL